MSSTGAASTEAFDQATLQALLADVPLVRAVYYLLSTTSTNDVLKRLAGEGAPEGTLVVADEQTAGRGRLERRWLAPPATSLLFSVLFRPSIPPSHALRLTMICSLGARDAIRDVLGLRISLKWPNDLLYEGRKLGGVLTETAFDSARIDFAVVGMGINVNWDPSVMDGLDQPATSLSKITGQDVSRATLLREIVRSVARRYAALQDGVSPVEEWATALETIGQQVTVYGGDASFDGVAVSVDDDGALLVRVSPGEVRRVVAGDVKLRGGPRQ